MIKNYEYGLLDPTVNAQLIADQMRAAHHYYNRLIEIERDRRAQVSKILVGHPDTEALAARVAALAAQREEARLAIKSTRQATRDRSETTQMRTRVKDLAAELKAARAELKAARDMIKTDVAIVTAIDAADTHAAERVRQARAACSAYWGSYLIQEQAVDAARKSKAPPGFKRWTGDGRVSVQLQGGISDVELFAADTQIQIVPVSPDAHDPGKSRGVHRRASRTILRMRVQSTEKGKPIWAEWPMILHRPIPDGARVKVATVSRRRRDCRRWDWRLLLTLEIPDDAGVSRALPVGGAVALNLGWCKRPEDAVRAGYVLSDDGVIDREMTVPPSTIDRVEKSEAIRSQRDKNLDAMRAAIVPWLRAHEAELPAWLVERTILSREPRVHEGSSAPHETETVGRLHNEGSSAPHEAETNPRDNSTPHATEAPQEQLGAPRAETVGSTRTRSWHVGQWRSAARFRALAFAWRSQRFTADDEGYRILEDWRYRDEHLERYESGMRRGGLLDRRERYRMLAADLAARYRTLVVDDFDLRKFQESPAPEDERVERPAAKRNQRHAAGSELRGALLNAFGPSRVIRESSIDVTRTCAAVVIDEATGAEHACGQIDEWDHAVAREHTCSGCGATWDQDQNACKNLLGRWRARAGTDELMAALPPRKESRSERLRRSRWKKTEDAAVEAAAPVVTEPNLTVAAPVPSPLPAVMPLPPTLTPAPVRTQVDRDQARAVRY